MSASPDVWLREGIAAARTGQVDRARVCLLRVIEFDDQNLRAWYWLSRVVQDPQEREICLENVLTLDPGHSAVRTELAELRRRLADVDGAALLSKESVADAVPLTAEEQLISDAAIEPLRCPYCGALTPVEDRQCPACGRELYTRRPKSKGHSIYSLGLVVAWFGLANYTWFGLFGYYVASGLLSSAQSSPGAGRTFTTLGELLGIEGATLPTLSLPVTPVLLGGGAVFLFSLFVAWGLYRRLRFFYWLTIVLIVLSFVASAAQAATAGSVSLVGLAIRFVAFLVTISAAFMAYDEFTWLDHRLDASVDSDVDSHSALFARGRECAERGMWAKAAAHWAKAVALSPGHPDYRLALASAYLRLDQPERAREHLAEARRIEPDHPQLAELWAALET